MLFFITTSLGAKSAPRFTLFNNRAPPAIEVWRTQTVAVAPEERKQMQRVAEERFLHKLGNQTQPQSPAPTLTSVVMTDEDIVNFLDGIKQGASWKKKSMDLKNFQYFFNLHNIL